jgi:Uma2 family endonuclease
MIHPPEETQTMTTATLVPVAAKHATTADLLAMPDDGVERWLVNGVIEEVGMTMRNKHHTRTESQVGHRLRVWQETQPAPHGAVYSGEVGVVLRADPELSVGIDVVYLNAEQAERNEGVDDDETTILVAPITLAVEVLSPSDTLQNIHRKLGWFAECGVPVVWTIDPYLRTVTVHRPGVPPVTFNETQELEGGPELPGFRVPVASLFER